MAEAKREDATRQEPRGFGEHTRKAPSENAHEQGWGLNEEERTRLPEGKQAWEGGRDYDYGAQDFGDIPADTSSAQPTPDSAKKTPGSESSAESRAGQRTSASRG